MVYNFCWFSPAQSFSSPSPVGLVAISYCLRFETSFSSPPTTRRATVGVFDPSSTWGTASYCQSRSHIATDSQSISKYWCRAPSGAHDQIFDTLWQLRLFFFGMPFLMRGWICLLYMLLALASIVFIGSDSLGTRDHTLLSQIRDFPFRRLLRLAGSRWRYSTPPPHGSSVFLLTTLLHGPSRKYRSQSYLYCCMRIRCRGDAFTDLLQRHYTLQ
jgi:hypothetical protein